MFELFSILGVMVFLIALPFVLIKERVIFLWIGGLVVFTMGLTAFHGIVCGPNSHDVKIMKPQAEAIADYIVKNGIPKSLKDIPDLPYKLMKCKREVQYGEEGGGNLKYKEGTKYTEIHEECIFVKKSNLYIATILFDQYYRSKYSINGLCDIESVNSKTSIRYDIDSNGLDVVKRDKEPYIIGNYSGICGSFGRQ